MRIEESNNFNPLPKLFEYIKTLSEVPLSNKHIAHIGSIFNKGNVYPETLLEVVELLVLFNKYYGIIFITVEDGLHYLRIKEDGSENE